MNGSRRIPVRVEMLSRFKTPKEQKAIMAATRDGQVDVLIGTHQLLNKSVYVPRRSAS